MVLQFLQFEEVSHGVAIEEGLCTGPPVDICSLRIQLRTYVYTFMCSVSLLECNCYVNAMMVDCPCTRTCIHYTDAQNSVSP